MPALRFVAWPASLVRHGAARWVWLLWAMDAVLVAGALSAGHGDASISRLAGDPAQWQLADFVVWQAVLPRFTVAALCGVALGLSGVLMQTLLRNPLASPHTLGASNGSQLLLSVAMIVAPQWLVHRELLSMAGGAMALGCVLLLSWRRGFSSASLALCGLIVSLYLGALNASLLILQPQGLGGLFIWGAGSLVQDGWNQVVFLTTRLGVGLLLLMALARPLQVLELGDSVAAGLGARVWLLRGAGLLLALFLSSMTVASVGVIGFVGLGAPALAGLLGARTVRERLLWTPCIGAGLVLAVDALLQWFYGAEAGGPPTGAVIGLFGAPLILVLIGRMASHLRRVQDRPAASSPAALGGRGPVVLVLAVVLAGALALSVGPGPDGWQVSFQGELMQLRAPRWLTAAGAGTMLAVAGVLLQRVTRNDMASPELLGLGAGTAFGLLLALMTVPLLHGGWHVAAGAATGIATLGVLALLVRGGTTAPERLLLAGIAFTSLFDAVQTLVLANVDPRGPGVLGWLSGSTYFAGEASAVAALAGAVIALAATWPLSRWLDMFSLGPEVLRTLAVPVAPAQLTAITMAAALTIAATLVLGPLSFIGLMAPHAARLLGYRRAREQLLAAAAIGFCTMSLADWLGRTVLYPMQMPAGLVAAILGGGYLVCTMGWQRGD